MDLGVVGYAKIPWGPAAAAAAAAALGVDPKRVRGGVIDLATQCNIHIGY